MRDPIFISYASPEDSAYVARLAARIETELKLPAWYYERDEPAGVYYDPEIVRQINGCQALVVILSQSSAFSNAVLMEVAYAQRKAKPIIPIVIGPIRKGRLDQGMTDGQVMFRLRVTNLIDARAGADPLPKLRATLDMLVRQPVASRDTVRLGEALTALPPEVAGGADDLAGKTVRGYEVVRLVARTLGSVVYLARDSAVERMVVLKAIHPEYASAKERFKAEAQRIADLTHPHIVPLYNFWTDDDGAYLVMPWMAGESLSALIGGSPNPPGLVARIVRQVGQALVYAHHRGVIHLDLKPGNILRDAQGNAFLADFGIARGRHEGLSRDEPSYTPGYAPPEQSAGAPVGVQADIYSLAVVIAELLLGARLFVGPEAVARQRAGPPEDTLTRLPGPVAPVIRRALAPDPALRHPDMLSFVTELQAALTAARGAAPTPDEEADLGAAPVDAPNPYMGLAPFTERDATRFYGRASAVARLLELLAQPHPGARLLAVAGASGSGKSSLVRAGLLPALRAGRLPGSERWTVRLLTPGAQPIESLAVALAAATGRPVAALRDELDSDEVGLLRAAAAAPGGALLLVIDQFEELFTLTADHRLRQHILASILAAVRDPASRLRVLVTLRGDFYDRPVQDQAFGELLVARTFWVQPLSEEELEDAIVQPARAVHVGVDRSLVREILADMAGRPGMLPLLQFTLADLFERREGGPLTLRAYRAGDGVRGALSRRAAEIYAGLTPGQQRLAQQLFLRLVTPGEGVADTRRRVRRSELADLASGAASLSATATTVPAGLAQADPTTGPAGLSGAAPALVWRHTVAPADLELVLERFGTADARLLTFDREPGGAPTVEVAHEALLDRQRGWKALGQWLDAARDDLRAQRRLAEAAAEWERLKCNEAFLAGGGTLAQYEEVAQRDLVDLTSLERRYLEASVAARASAEAAEEARRQRELEQAQRLAEEQAERARLATLQAEQAQRLAEEQAERARLATLQAEKEQQLSELATLRAEEQAAANRQLRRRTVWLRVFLAATFLALLAAFLFGYQAQAQLQVVASQRLAAESAGLLSVGETERALLLALEAVRLDQNPASYEALQQAVVGSPFARSATFSDRSGPITSAAFSPDGARVLTLTAGGAGDVSAGRARLWGAQGQPVAVLEGHAGAVRSATFSPQGTRVLTASEDGTARLWDAQGQPVAVLEGHAGAVRSAVFSPLSNLILTGSEDGTARLWDAQGQPVAVLEGHAGAVRSAVFGPLGTLILTASEDGTARLWNAQGQLLRVVPKQPAGLTRALLSPDGTRILTLAADNTLRLWDDDVRSTISGHTGAILSVVFSADSQYLLTASSDGTARLWDTESRELVVFRGHTAAVNSAVFSPDGAHVLTASDDGTVRLWERGGRLMATLKSHDGAVVSAAYSSDGAQILTAGKDGRVQLWRTGGLDLEVLAGHRDGLLSAAFSPDGAFIVTGSLDATARLWDRRGTLLARLTGHQGPVRHVAFSPDGARLLTASDDGTARIWDLEGEQVAVLEGHTADVLSAGFSPDGARILTASADGTARLWTADGEQVAVLKGHTADVLSAGFSPDGARILTASTDGTARLWDRAGNLLATLPDHRDGVWVALFSPDGQRIFSAAGVDDRREARSTWRNSARLWDAEGRRGSALQGDLVAVRDAAFSPDGSRLLTVTGNAGLPTDQAVQLRDSRGRLLATLRGHAEAIWSAAFSPDAARIVTASSDGTARVWSAGGELEVTLQGHADEVLGAIFSPDGSRVLTFSSDRTARLWPVHLEDWRAAATCKVARPLSDEEIRIYEIPTPPPAEEVACPPSFSWDQGR